MHKNISNQIAYLIKYIIARVKAYINFASLKITKRGKSVNECKLHSTA